MLKGKKSQLLSLVLVAALAGCASKNHMDKNLAESVPPPSANTEITTGQTTGTVDSSASTAGEKDGMAQTQTIFYFDFDQDNIKPEAYGSLKTHAKFLSDNAAARVRLEGNTDEAGTREYNIALGERRAKAVAQFLGLNGAESDQIETVSYGEEKPVALEHDESAYAQNRRVELTYTAGK